MREICSRCCAGVIFCMAANWVSSILAWISNWSMSWRSHSGPPMMRLSGAGGQVVGGCDEDFDG